MKKKTINRQAKIKKRRAYYDQVDIMQMPNVNLIGRGLNRLKIGSKHTPYQATLLDPFNKFNETVPNDWVQDTITFRRQITFTINTNSSGNLSTYWNPAFLSQNNVNTTFFYNNDNSNTLVTATANTSTAGQTNYQVPSGNVAAMRVVSAGLRCTSQATFNNRSGTIYAAMMPGVNSTVTNNGATGLAVYPLSFIPAIEQHSTYKMADAGSMEAMQVVWLPYDKDNSEMIPPEYTISTITSTHAENLIIVLVGGTVAATPMKFELVINYELTPASGSVLNGFECRHKSVGPYPSKQTDDIWQNHSDIITRTYKSSQSLAIANNSIVGAKTSGLKFLTK